MTQIIHNSNINFFKENSELPFIPEIYLIRFHQVRHPQPDHLYLTPDNEKWVIKCTMIYRYKLVCMFAVKWYAIFKSTNLPKLKNLTIPCYFNYQLSISFQLPFHYFQKLCLYICHMPEHILNHIFYMYTWILEHIFFNDLQLYMMHFKRSDGATFPSVCFGVSIPFFSIPSAKD